MISLEKSLFLEFHHVTSSVEIKLFWHGISRLNEESDDNLKLFVDKLKMSNVADIK